MTVRPTTRRRGRKALLITVAAVGLLGAGSSPVQAASTPGYWRTYTKTANWKCAPAITLTDRWGRGSLPGMYVQSCALMDRFYGTAVLVVTNKTGGTVTLQGAFTHLDRYPTGDAYGNSFGECYKSALGNNQTRACYGPKIQVGCDTVYAQSQVEVWSAAGRHYEPVPFNSYYGTGSFCP